MRLPANLKLDLLVAAALAGLGLLTAASSQRPRARGRPVGAAAGLAALREELHPPPASGRATGQSRGTDRAHGRDAATPSQIPARGWWDIAKRTASQTMSHQLMTQAAGVTFYALLAIFPALAALVSLYGLFSDPAAVSAQLDAIGGVVPGGGMQILDDQLHRVVSTSGGALSFGALFGLLVALWSANGGTKAMFAALNVVYDEQEKRSFVRLTLISLALTLGALIVMVIAIAAVVALPIALNYVGLSKPGAILIRLMRWPLLLVVVAILLAVMFRYGPSRTEAKWRWVSWGGVFAAVVWVLVSVAFSWYVSHFGSYNKTYGSLGAVVGFMTWIWISTTVVLIGAELNAEMEHQTRHDSTAGTAKPLGARGATKADEVAAV